MYQWRRDRKVGGREEGKTDTKRWKEMQDQVGQREERWGCRCCGSWCFLGSKILSFMRPFSISCSWDLCTPTLWNLSPSNKASVTAYWLSLREITHPRPLNLGSGRDTLGWGKGSNEIQDLSWRSQGITLPLPTPPPSSTVSLDSAQPTLHP